MNFKNPQLLFLSLFGAGFFPRAPGTFASLISLIPLYLLHKFNVHVLLFAFIFILLVLISCLCINQFQKKYNLHDPSWIVIDEFLGIILFFPFIINFNAYHLLSAFVLFRIFDIIKIFPASYFDKIDNGYGVVIDDIVSSIYAISVYRVLFLIVDFL